MFCICCISVPLGWASIALVELDAWNSQKWIGINQQETFFPLHPGDIPVELGVSETYIPVDQINLSKCKTTQPFFFILYIIEK